jgi:hypothetical protein
MAGMAAICDAYVSSSSPLMLCIGGTIIMTGYNQARRIVDESCLKLKLTNKH